MMTPEDLIKAIPSWTLKDVMKAVEGIKEAFGISEMALAGASTSAAPQQTEAPQEEKTEFTVVLTGFAEGKKIGVMKGLRTLGASLPDAKKMVEGLGSAPVEVKTGIPKAEAEDLKKQLEEAGGTVEIK